MELKDEKAYTDWKENNTDAYGAAIFRYAENWANLMEKEISEGGALESIAERTSHEADTEGVTGYMYGAAVNILALCWYRGEPLRQWHNKEYKYDGSGVVNPAVLTVKQKSDD